MWSSRQQLESNAQSKAKYAYLGENLGLCIVLGGYKMFLNPKDMSLAPHLIMSGCWESWISLIVPRLIKEGDVVVDVGCNFGYYSLMMADLVGEGGKLYSFDANPDMCNYTKKSLMINGYRERSRVYNQIMWSEIGVEKEFWIPDVELGGASVYVGEGGKVIKGKTMTLDGIDDLKERVDFVKIDAEAAEPHVYRGMKKIIENNPDVKILMEWTPGAVDSKGFLKEVTEDGFNIYLVTTNGTLVPLTEDPKTLEMILCVKGAI